MAPPQARPPARAGRSVAGAHRRAAAGPGARPCARDWRRAQRPADRAAPTPPSALPEVAALIAFSALPFFGIQALADGPAGKRLAEGLAARKPALEEAAAAAERARREAAARSPLYGTRRNTAWLGPFGVPDSLAAPHLTGAAPADAAFDPLGLAAGSADDFDRYLELELLHGRWAMLGALGAVVPEALTLWGGASFSEVGPARAVHRQQWQRPAVRPPPRAPPLTPRRTVGFWSGAPSCAATIWTTLACPG